MRVQIPSLVIILLRIEFIDSNIAVDIKYSYSYVEIFNFLLQCKFVGILTFIYFRVVMAKNNETCKTFILW